MSNSIQDILGKLRLLESKEVAKPCDKPPSFQKSSKKDDEIADPDKDVVEDIVVKMKRGLDDYLKSIEDGDREDSDIHPKTFDTRDITKRVSVDRDLIPREDPIKRAKAVLASAPVKTIKIDDVTECGIYGDEDAGFEIRRGEKVLPTKFKALDHAIAAADTYAAMRRAQNTNPDYREEK